MGRLVAGELLFRLLERRAFEVSLRGERLSANAAKTIFLDRGNWSLNEPAGLHHVLIDGSAFAIDAPWMYEDHDTFEVLPIEDSETATLAIPDHVVAAWRRRIEILPVDGEVARTRSDVRDALIVLMDRALENDELGLTVECLL
jgi:hypothetical protein